MRSSLMILFVLSIMLNVFQQATHIEVVTPDNMHHSHALEMADEQQHEHPASAYHDCHGCAHHHAAADLFKAEKLAQSAASKPFIYWTDKHFSSRMSYPPSRPPKA